MSVWHELLIKGDSTREALTLEVKEELRATGVVTLLLSSKVPAASDWPENDCLK